MARCSITLVALTLCLACAGPAAAATTVRRSSNCCEVLVRVDILSIESGSEDNAVTLSAAGERDLHGHRPRRGGRRRWLWRRPVGTSIACHLDVPEAISVRLGAATTPSRRSPTTRSPPLGSTLVEGEGGNDAIDVSPDASVFLYPGAGWQLTGGSGDDRLTGSAAGDRLSGDAGNDVERGGGGDDLLYEADLSGSNGGDTLDGGAGRDSVSYEQRLAGVTATADGIADDGEASERDNITADVEVLTGGLGDDRLAAGPNDSALTGDQGDDVMTGGPGDDTVADSNEDMPQGVDTLSGGGGDDTLDGGGNADDIRGGSGEDTEDNGNRTQPLTVTLDDRPNDGASGEGDNVHADVEVVRGGSAGDVLVGSNGSNRIFGLGGDDSITGGGGIDLLRGGDGNDRLFAQDLLADDAACGAGTDAVQADVVDVGGVVGRSGRAAHQGRRRPPARVRRRAVQADLHEARGRRNRVPRQTERVQRDVRDPRRQPSRRPGRVRATTSGSRRSPSNAPRRSGASC